jgi:hypothetical protein
MQAAIVLYSVATVRWKSLNIVGSLERGLIALGIALDLKGCMLDILKKKKWCYPLALKLYILAPWHFLARGRRGLVIKALSFSD